MHLPRIVAFIPKTISAIAARASKAGARSPGDGTARAMSAAAKNMPTEAIAMKAGAKDPQYER